MRLARDDGAVSVRGTHDWLLHSSSQASTSAPASSSVRRPVSSASSGCTGTS